MDDFGAGNKRVGCGNVYLTTANLTPTPIAGLNKEALAKHWAQTELELYQKMAGVAKPLLPQAKEDYFNAITWWLKSDKKNRRIANRGSFAPDRA